MAASAGVLDVDTALQDLVAAGEIIEISISSNRQLHVHKTHISEIVETIRHRLTRFHDENPLAAGLRLDQIHSQFGYLPHIEIANYAVQKMIEEKLLEKRQTLLGLEGRGPAVVEKRTSPC